mgnify:CR=1 FL=1
MNRTTWFCWLAAMSAVLFTATRSAPAANQNKAQTPTMAERLSADDFWTTAGKDALAKWSDDQLAELRKLSASDNAVVRLRANKLLVDHAGNGRLNVGPGSADIAAAAFRFLESHLDNPSVKDLCIKQGFAHYHVSHAGGGGAVFLIEHVGAGGFNGGINLRWNETNHTVARFEVWGDVAL